MSCEYCASGWVYNGCSMASNGERALNCLRTSCPQCGDALNFFQWTTSSSTPSITTPNCLVPESTKLIIASATNRVVYSAVTGNPTLAPVYWGYDHAANVIRYYAGVDLGSVVSVASTESTSTIMWSYTTGTANSTTQYNWTPGTETKEEKPAAPKLRSFKGSVAGKVKITE